MDQNIRGRLYFDALLIGLIALLAACLFLAGRFLYAALTMERSTFSVVALDPQSGDVGIAGASCVPISAGAMTSLVPGTGAAATQAGYIPANHARVFELLQSGRSAEEIIAVMSDETHDQGVATRQYGVVTLGAAGVQAAGFTGRANNAWAGDRQDEGMAVSVQGNTLESAAVVADALAAYSADIGPVELPDRLMRALEAASAAGGDLRCNDADVAQTAQAAFIAFSRADQPAFAAELGRDPTPSDPDRPWLYISVIETKGGANPLLDLRSRYDAWRAENLPVCDGCDLQRLPVPPGGGSKPVSRAFLGLVSRIGIVGLAGCCCILLVLLLGLLVVFLRRRRRPA